MRLLHVAVLLWLLAPHALAGSPTAAGIVQRGTVQQVVSLTARDGHSVPGILMYPSEGLNPHSPGVVLLHGGPFGHPIRTQSAARFVAERLAARGYTTLSILSRHAGGYYSIPVEAGSADIATAIDWLAGLGIRDVVLAGHSFGSARIALYVAESKDPRVKALVHYAPTRGSSEYLPQAFGGARYAELVEELRARVAAGRGEEPTLIEIPFPPPAPPGSRFAYIMTAANWLSWWGPEAKAQNQRLIPRLSLPMLMITGEQDMFVTREYQEQLAKAATASPRVDTLMYEGTGHELSGAEDRAAADTERWLTGIGLGVRPRVTMRLVDVQVSASGASYALMQAGMLYEPATGARADLPSVLLLYDRGQDVLTNPSEWLAPALAQRGYRVLVPQDSSYGPNVDRVAGSATDGDLRSWVEWLGGAGQRPVVIAGRGWGGERAARFLRRHSHPTVRGLVLLNPLPDGGRWARREMGDAEYDAAIARAVGAAAQGRGASTLIAARSASAASAMSPTSKAANSPYRFHLLADAFLAQYGPQRETLAQVLTNLDQSVMLVSDRSDDPLAASDFAGLESAAGARATVYVRENPGLAGRSDDALADAAARWLQGLSTSTPMVPLRKKR